MKAKKQLINGIKLNYFLSAAMPFLHDRQCSYESQKTTYIWLINGITFLVLQCLSYMIGSVVMKSPKAASIWLINRITFWVLQCLSYMPFLHGRQCSYEKPKSSKYLTDKWSYFLSATMPFLHDRQCSYEKLKNNTYLTTFWVVQCLSYMTGSVVMKSPKNNTYLIKNNWVE